MNAATLIDGDLEAKLDEAREAVFEVRLAHLNGVRAREESHTRLWAHLSDVVYTLAVMQADTPREIAEQAFGFLPTGEEWRKMRARWAEADAVSQRRGGPALWLP